MPDCWMGIVCERVECNDRGLVAVAAAAAAAAVVGVGVLVGETSAAGLG